ncbi:MAG: hypothetical protein QXP70_02480 [Methanomassiliicoccales archaeon]
MAGSYFGNMKLGKQLAEKAKELAREKEEAEARMKAMEDMLSAMKQLGISNATVADLVAKARQAFDDHSFRDAFAAATKACDACRTLIREVFMQRMEATNRMIDLMGQAGRDGGKYKQSLESVSALIDKDNFSEGEEKLAQLWSELHKSLSELFSTGYSRLQNELNEAKAGGLDTDVVEATLSEARNEMDTGNFERSFELLSKAEAELHTGTARELEELTRTLAERLELAERLGLNIEPYTERVRQAKEDGDRRNPRYVKAILSSINGEVERKLTRLLEMSLKNVQHETTLEGISPELAASCNSRLSRASELLSKHSFEETLALLRSMEADLESAKYVNVARILVEGKKHISEAVKAGIDIEPINNRLLEIREMMKKKRYLEAIRAANEANEEARKLIEPMQAARELMKSLEDSFSSMKALNVSSVEMNIKFNQAKRVFESRDYAQFNKLANGLLQDIDLHLENFVKGQIDAIDRKISAVEYLGGDSLEMNRRVEGVLSFMKARNFTDAISAARELDELADAELSKLEVSWKNRAQELLPSQGEQLRSRLEQILSDVSVLEANGETYRAACIAKDVVDWAVNGDTYRAKTLLQRARRLISLTDGAGKNAASLMIEDAEKSIDKNKERALQLAGQAYDMLFKLVNDRFSSDMNRLLESLASCRKKKIEIGYGYTLIARARSAVKYEDFEAAFRLMSLASSEIDEKLRNVEELERQFALAQRLAKEMQQRNMDCTEVQRMLSEASAAMSGFDHVLLNTLVTDLLETEEKALAAFKAPAVVVRVKELMDVAVTIGAPVEKLNESRQRINELMRKRDYYAALQEARKCEAELRDTMTKSLDKWIDELKDECSRLEMSGTEISGPLGQIEQAMSLAHSGNFVGAARSLSMASDELKQVNEAMENCRKKVEEAEEALNTIDELGLSDANMESLLREARAALKEGKYLLGLGAAIRCSEAVVQAIKSKGGQVLEAARKQMESLFEQQLPPHIMEEIASVQRMIEAGDISVVQRLLKLKTDSEMISLQKDAAHKTLEIAQSRMQSLEESGVKLPAMKAKMEEIRGLISTHRYKEAVKEGIAAQQFIESVGGKYAKLSDEMSALKAFVTGMGEAGFKLEETDTLFSEIDSLLSAGEHDKAEEMLKAAEKRLKDGARKTLLAQLTNVAKMQASAKALGYQESNAAERIMGLIESKEFIEAAVQLAASLHSVSLYITSKLQEKLHSLLDNEWMPIALAQTASTRLSSMLSAGNYTEAVAYIHELERTLSGKEQLGREMHSLSLSVEELISHLKSSGLPVRQYEIKAREAQNRLDESALPSLHSIEQELLKLRKNLSPKILLEGRISRWGSQIEVTNAGRVVALGLEVNVTGGIASAVTIGDLKPGESRSITLSNAAGKDFSVQLTGKNPLSGSELNVSRTFRFQNNTLTSVATCAFCRGKIKGDLPVSECICGRIYHSACASRMGSCECGEKLS